MTPVTLEEDTLGKKRQHYNKLVEDAIADKHYKLCDISGDDSDIDNLLKIDIASRIRNVDYIIEVMKSKDMLYAATAIKKSTWLITEQQYANIINPEYLHTQLLPSMNTKTFNKLMLHIRLNLKDESRVESFYEYLKQTDSAYKWLQNCSIPFIENVIKNERLVPLSLFKRLCRRSAHFLTYHKRVDKHRFLEFRAEMLFLFKSHTEELLKFLEEDDNIYGPKIGKKKTEILMKTCPQRVFDEFKKFTYIVDLSVVAKYLEKEKIKPFLYKEMKPDQFSSCEFDKLRHFVKNMPKEEKLQFITQTFINKTDLSFLRSKDESINSMDVAFYHWYEYVPFNVAFPELKKLILAENSPSERIAMLSILITSARRNPEHIKTLLKFVKHKHINEPFKFKNQFVNNLLSQISTHEFDVETWNVLDQLFHSMEVYTESDNNVQLCLESIILYRVLHDEPVPEIIEQKVTINNIVKIQKKLNKEQNDKIFTYLLNLILAKVPSENIANESDFSETVVQLKNALTLIRDWNKDISKYPKVLEKIQKLNKIKHQNTWKTDMSCLYNMKKSWRKHMFEESLSLCLCEEACLNALKHKPQLLTRHDKEIDTLRTNDAVSLRRLLAKLRVYWPHSLAQHWTDAYLLNLNKPTGQKAVVRGLFLLLSQNQVIDMAKKYVPEDYKIHWGETNQADINIRKNIAQKLHVTRPLIPLDTILWYAKGDYLQHAVPSLNAVLSNLSEVESREYVLKLLKAPVSLRKLGLHLAFTKLKPNELKENILNIWNTTTNSTIRCVIFKNTYRQICKVKNINVEKELWQLLSTFINKLSSRENREIFKYLVKVEDIPSSVRAEYYMKSYEFLTSFPDSDKYDRIVNTLVSYVRNTPYIVKSFNDDFVTEKLLSPAGTKFCLLDSNFIGVFATYVLWGKTEEDQLQRFRRTVDPAMGGAFLSWHKTHYNVYYVKNNFEEFLKSMVLNFRVHYTLNKIPLPVQLFVAIKMKMEKEMPLLENYALYTSWKLLTEYVKVMDEHTSEASPFDSNQFSESDYDCYTSGISNEMNNAWKAIHFKISPTLGSRIVKYLKEDTELYSPTIHYLFLDAFEKMFDLLSFYNPKFELEVLKHMLNDHDFTPSYVVVSRAISNRNYVSDDSSKIIQTEIRKKIKAHPSQEVQMHYYNDFKDIPFSELEKQNNV